MTPSFAASLGVLYEQDETAWLESMSELVSQRRFTELDHVNLAEYLADMAKRDRREVFSRLVALMTHLLKWEHQPDQRSGSWRATIREQRWELEKLLESATLLNHAQNVTSEAYEKARKQAADQTDLPLAAFPVSCPWELEAMVADD